MPSIPNQAPSPPPPFPLLEKEIPMRSKVHLVLVGVLDLLAVQDALDDVSPSLQHCNVLVVSDGRGDDLRLQPVHNI